MKVTAIFKKWYKWDIYFYLWEQLFWEVHFKKPIKEDTKICKFLFDIIDEQFRDMEAVEMELLKEHTYISSFLNANSKKLNDEQIEAIFWAFEVLTKKKSKILLSNQ